VASTFTETVAIAARAFIRRHLLIKRHILLSEYASFFTTFARDITAW
jgi:hypothetical protein